MTTAPHGVDPNLALLTDLYQLTMLQAYWREGLQGTAVFDLFCRRLPPSRNFLVACGLEEVLDYLESLHFNDSALAYLSNLGQFSPGFLEYLADFRFTGDVYAMPEGTPLFAGEPLLEVVAPLPEGQLVETYILNQVHYQTLVASKAVRVVTAAAGRPVIDFGLRRYHGIDAGMKAARAAYIAGADASSNVMAGQRYGIPVTGTMAHSYVMAHQDDYEAFRRFAELYPDTVLLVDTYDTLQGVEAVIRLARELGRRFRVRAVRLDSGDIATLAVQVRGRLDAAGLQQVEIFVSGDLDEDRVAELVASGAPIDGFGVGTRMGTSADAPYLNVAYKLVAYDGQPRMKLSTGKATLPGRKQVFRVVKDGVCQRDVVALHDEHVRGRPLLDCVMQGGRRTRNATPTLAATRAYCPAAVAELPAQVRGLSAPERPYAVEVSYGLAAERDHLLRTLLA